MSKHTWAGGRAGGEVHKVMFVVCESLPESAVWQPVPGSLQRRRNCRAECRGHRGKYRARRRSASSHGRCSPSFALYISLYLFIQISLFLYLSLSLVMSIILVYAISDIMFQANHSYEWFLHHIMDNTK
jgi:hypothetical protein